MLIWPIQWLSTFQQRQCFNQPVLREQVCQITSLHFCVYALIYVDEYTVVCKKIAAAHEKALFWLFLLEIPLRFGKALNCRQNKYLEKDKHCKRVTICIICMTINFCMTTPPFQNNSSAHSKTIGRFWVICTKCHETLQTKRQKWQGPIFALNCT